MGAVGKEGCLKIIDILQTIPVEIGGQNNICTNGQNNNLGRAICCDGKRLIRWVYADKSTKENGERRAKKQVALQIITIIIKFPQLMAV